MHRIDGADASFAQVLTRVCSHFPAAERGTWAHKRIEEDFCSSPETFLLLRGANNADGNLNGWVIQQEEMEFKQNVLQLQLWVTYRNSWCQVKCLFIQNLALKQGQRVGVRRKGIARGREHSNTAAATNERHLSGGHELNLQNTVILNAHYTRPSRSTHQMLEFRAVCFDRYLWWSQTTPMCKEQQNGAKAAVIRSWAPWQ
jgi:hypothetical protein